MSSAGQPENNDLTHRQGFEVQVRHPAGGARLWQRYGQHAEIRLRLSASQRHVLAAIQNELQADAELAAAFSAFTSVTSGAAMPKAERLPARSTLAGWRGCCRAVLKRRIMIVVAVVAALAAVLALALAASSAGAAALRCDPAYAFAPACHGPSWAPAGVGGQLQGLPYPPPSLWPPVMTMRSLVMSSLRKVLRGLFGPLTTRGRSFLAAGGAAVVCGLAIPEPDLVRVGALLFVLPVVSALIVRRSRYRLACSRRLDPPRVAVGQSTTVTARVESVSRPRTGVLVAEDVIPDTLGYWGQPAVRAG